MFKIFKKKEEVPTPADAIQNLRGTEDMLLKKQDFLEKKIESEVEIARKNAKTNKRAALVALKRKKRFEKQLQQIDGTLTTIGTNLEYLFLKICSLHSHRYVLPPPNNLQVPRDHPAPRVHPL